MKRRISNKTKDKLLLTGIAIVLIWLLISVAIAVISLFAEELTEPNQINKYYAEETIKTEMQFLAMWEYTENMLPEEYNKTFLGGK